MRELKFRGWDKGRSRMTTYFYVTSAGIVKNANLARLLEDMDVEVMQYTGLKAKNGEIYEGDIIRLSNSSDSTIFGNEIGVVEFMENRACWYLNTGDFNDWTQLNREIIGNIYENPELLRKK